jgi:transposase
VGGDKKKAAEEDREIVFVDEAGFHVQPHVASGWARRGETPVAKYAPAKHHLSVISAVTTSGKLFYGMEERALVSDDVIRFVKRVQRCVGRSLLVIWDGAGIHTSHAVRDALRDGLSPNVWLERLPPYAPDLNPDEGIWSLAKRRLSNVCALSVNELTFHVRRVLEAIRRSPRLVLSCFGQARLTLDVV